MENTCVICFVLAYENTIVCKLIKLTRVVTLNDKADAFVAVTVAVKAVCIAVDISPCNVSVGVTGCAAVVVGTVIVLCTCTIVIPLAVYELAVCIKVEGNKAVAV